MKTIEMVEATGSLSEYARKGLKEPLIVTRRGRPVLAVMPLAKEDWENVSLATNPEFMAIIQRSRASHRRGTGISTAEMRRRLGSTSKRAVSKRTRPSTA